MTSDSNSTPLWDNCLQILQNDESIPENDFNLWLRPLQANIEQNNINLLAPNEYVVQFVKDRFLSKITDIFNRLHPTPPVTVGISIGSIQAETTPTQTNGTSSSTPTSGGFVHTSPKTNFKKQAPSLVFGGTHGETTGNLNPKYLFDNHVIGDSNRLARAAGIQVSNNPGEGYNPLFLYGGVGLGKTHLTHAMGNHIKQNNPNAKVLYLHSERFVADMIKSLQRNQMDQFKKFYRSVNCLLIDDIQFFANKERSQEEFFHTFNYLLDDKQQIVLTCDRYPKEISGLEERLQSRFGWGLTVAIEPPELETRIAILMSKAKESHVDLPDDVAFFIAKHIQSNVRELEGALKRVIANAQFTGQKLSVGFAREALKDLLALQAKLITIDNIQKTVADYYKIKVADLLCKRRSRSIARPRQLAMFIAKELTTHSLPEIGDAFGGRDHTTVLHACRKMKELLSSNLSIQEDQKNLLRILSA